MTVVIGGAGRPLVIEAVRDIVAGSQSLSLAVSFLQVSGWDLLRTALSPQQIGTLRIVCDDQMGITNPEAVRQILAAGGQVRAHSGANIYHPKVFVGHHTKGPAKYLIGSANLSEPALIDSVEAGMTGVDADGSVVAWFDDLFANRSAAFDDARLRLLDAAFAARSRARLFFRRQVAAPTNAVARSSTKAGDLELLDSLFSTLGDLPHRRLRLLAMTDITPTLRAFARSREPSARIRALYPPATSTCQTSGMRAISILLAALMLGATGGYAWSMLASAPAAHPHLPKASMTAIAPSPEELPEEADKEWSAEASDNVQNAEAASRANVTE